MYFSVWILAPSYYCLASKKVSIENKSKRDVQQMEMLNRSLVFGRFQNIMDDKIIVNIAL